MCRGRPRLANAWSHSAAGRPAQRGAQAALIPGCARSARRTVATVSSRLAGSIGFATWSFMPAARQRCRSSIVACAVIAMIGSVAVRGSARSCAVPVAVHHRHLQVHEHHVERRRLRPPPDLDRLASVVATVDRAPRALEQLAAICWLISLSSASEDPRRPRARMPLGSARRRRSARPLREDVHQRVDEHRLVDRLEEKAIELQPFGLVARLPHVRMR